jgi:hypothetical protein
LPFGLALDGDNTLYVADAFNDVIRRVDLTTFEVETVAGVPDEEGHLDGAVGTALCSAPHRSRRGHTPSCRAHALARRRHRPRRHRPSARRARARAGSAAAPHDRIASGASVLKPDLALYNEFCARRTKNPGEPPRYDE